MSLSPETVLVVRDTHSTAIVVEDSVLVSRETSVGVVEHTESVVVRAQGPTEIDDFAGVGSRGLVPDPGVGDAARVLRSDGTWGAQSGGGGGSGDMEAAVYDPTGVADDAFDMANMAEAADAKVMTAAERSKLAGVESGATADQVASEVPFTATGGVSSTDVQAAIAELDGDKAATAHGHAISDVTGLQTALDGKAATVHTHATSDVTGLDASLAAKLEAPVANVSLADMATATIKGRATAGTGDPEDLTASQVRTIINVADGANAYTHPNHTGDVTSTGDGATTLADDAVTNAKLADVAERTVKGRSAAGTGDPSDLTLGALADLLGSDATLRFGTNQSFTTTTFIVLLDWDDTRLDPDWFTYDGATGEFTVIRACSIVLTLRMSITLNAAGTATFQTEVAVKNGVGTYVRINDFLATQLCVSTTDATTCAMTVAWIARAGDVFVVRARKSAGAAQVDTNLAWSWLTLEASLRP